jgi:oligopeptide/dipeptide ABC transporter ATP-binding protein
VSAASDGPLLDVRGLSAGFRTEAGFVHAVEDVSFRLGRGETFGIVGESGSGKSALCLALLRLLPPIGRITAGSAHFAGEDLVLAPIRRIRELRGRRIGLVFQDPMTSLNPYLRVGEQIAEPLRRHLRMSARSARERTLALLTQVGIPEPEVRIDRYPHELSGGQRQRVLIAMALSCDPDLLIADEPTTALDVTIQAQILELIRAEQRRRRMALILITHNLAVASRTCDSIAVMYAGRVVEHAPSAALFRAPRHPYTRALLASIPRLETDRERPLASITGHPPSLVGEARGCAFAPRCPHAIDRCRSETPYLRSVKAGHDHRCLLDLDAPVGGTSP